MNFEFLCYYNNYQFSTPIIFDGTLKVVEENMKQFTEVLLKANFSQLS